MSINFNTSISNSESINPLMVRSLKLATVTTAVAGTFYALSSGTINLSQALSTTAIIGILSIYLMKQSAEAEEDVKPSLAPSDFIEARPTKVKEAIDEIFSKLSCKVQGCWAYNGEDSSYRILKLSELSVVENIIRKAPLEQKNFYIIDLGAGNFEVANTIAKFIQKNKHLLRPDQKVYILSVRGEINEGPSLIKEEKVIRHNLGGFKIENLSKTFQDLGFSLENNADLILSSWTFRHLVDPIGTLAQTYNLLKENGLLLMDGFFTMNETDTTFDGRRANYNLKQVLTKLGAPVFLKYIPTETELTQFALKKPNLTPFPLKMKYLEEPLELPIHPSNHSFSNIIARFEEEEEDNSLPYLGPDTIELKEHSGFYPIHYGDKALADELTDNSQRFGLTLQHYMAHAEVLESRKKV